MQYELLNHDLFIVLSTLFHSEATYKGIQHISQLVVIFVPNYFWILEEIEESFNWCYIIQSVFDVKCVKLFAKNFCEWGQVTQKTVFA